MSLVEVENKQSSRVNQREIGAGVIVREQPGGSERDSCRQSYSHRLTSHHNNKHPESDGGERQQTWPRSPALTQKCKMQRPATFLMQDRCHPRKFDTAHSAVQHFCPIRRGVCVVMALTRTQEMCSAGVRGLPGQI